MGALYIAIDYISSQDTAVFWFKYGSPFHNKVLQEGLYRHLMNSMVY